MCLLFRQFVSQDIFDELHIRNQNSSLQGVWWSEVHVRCLRFRLDSQSVVCVHIVGNFLSCSGGFLDRFSWFHFINLFVHIICLSDTWWVFNYSLSLINFVFIIVLVWHLHPSVFVFLYSAENKMTFLWGGNTGREVGWREEVGWRVEMRGRGMETLIDEVVTPIKPTDSFRLAKETARRNRNWFDSSSSSLTRGDVSRWACKSRWMKSSYKRSEVFTAIVIVRSGNLCKSRGPCVLPAAVVSLLISSFKHLAHPSSLVFLRSYLSFRTYSRCVSHQGSAGPFQLWKQLGLGSPGERTKKGGKHCWERYRRQTT